MTKPSQTVFDAFCDMAIMLGFEIERHPDKLIVFFDQDNEPDDRQH